MAQRIRKGEQSKYQIMAKHPGQELPHAQRWADTVADREIQCEMMHAEHPTSIIEVRLCKSFSHLKPIRWRYDPSQPKKDRFAVIGLYNRFVAGNGVLTKAERKREENAAPLFS